jgi:hypothetical protein
MKKFNMDMSEYSEMFHSDTFTTAVAIIAAAGIIVLVIVM